MYKALSQAEILIASPVRNNAETLATEVRTLLNIVTGFKKAYCLVIESDSTDNTLSELEALKQSYASFDYISLGFIAKKMLKRTERLAFARDRVLDEVVSNPAFGGLGIYKRNALLAGCFIGLDDLGNEAYEHISLHQDLRKAGYRISINCALVNSTHHTDLPPPLPKGRTMAAIKLLQTIGISLFADLLLTHYLLIFYLSLTY